jgi:hypothetical protein
MTVKNKSSRTQPNVVHCLGVLLEGLGLAKKVQPGGSAGGDAERYRPSEDGKRCKTAINVGLLLLEHYLHGSDHHTVDSDVSAAFCLCCPLYNGR